MDLARTEPLLTLPCVISQTFWRSFTLLTFNGQMPKTGTRTAHERTTQQLMKHVTVVDVSPHGWPQKVCPFPAWTLIQGARIKRKAN